MSRKVNVCFEVRNMLIMKDTLKQLGHVFTETQQDVLQIQASYMPTTINGKAQPRRGQMSSNK